MDPVTVTTAALAFIEALNKAIFITSNACNLATSLAERSKEYSHISQQLNASVTFLERLFQLKEAIAQIDDQKIRNMGIPTDSLFQHLENAEALSLSLQKRQRHHRGFRKPATLAKLVIQPENMDSDLEQNFRKFQRSFNSISGLLNTFQAFAMLSIKESQKTNHEGTIESLDALSAERRWADVTLGLSVRQLQKSVSSSEGQLVKLKGSVDSTAEDVKRIDQSISEANSSIVGLSQSLQAIDKSIHTFNAHKDFAEFPGTVFGIPYPRKRCFIGRESILTEIHQFLVPQHGIHKATTSLPISLRVFVVHGLPGIGKTNLAIEFGHRRKDLFTHTFWIAADSEEKFSQGLINMARSLGLVHKTVTEDKEKVIDGVMSWLKSAKQNKLWLLILDNVDDPQILNPLLSNLSSGCLLITSRDPIPGVTAMAIECRTSQLRELSPDEGARFIKQRLDGNIQGGITDDSAAKLAKRFAYYPLYMDQMTSFIEASVLTLDQFYDQVDTELGDHELQDLQVGSPWYPTSLAKAIENHIAKHSFIDSQSREILSVVAFFDPDSIPERLLFSTDGKVPCLSTGLRRQKILLRLSQPSFICISPGNNTHERCISVHRLVRDAALRSDPSIQTAFDIAVCLLRTAFPLHKMSRDHMMEDWEECEIFQPHVLSMHSHYLDLRNQGRLRPSFEFIELAYSCAWYLCERGRLSISEKLISSLFKDYMALRKTVPEVPTSFLADIYTVQLFFHNEAIHGGSLVDLAVKAMEIREEAVRIGSMDEFHPNRANGPMNVGVVVALEDPRRAIHFHTKALGIRLGSDKYQSEQIHGLALNYLNIGRCRWIVGELDQAASCFEKSLAILTKREKQIGKRFSFTAWALAALGIVRADQNNLESAMKLLSESLEFHLDTLGERHMKTLACYYRLGWVCYRLGEFGRAEQLLSICLKAYTESPTEPKAEIARTKFQLSRVLMGLGREQETWHSMEQEAFCLLQEILTKKEGKAPAKKTFCESDYDNQVVYFLR